MKLFFLVSMLLVTPAAFAQKHDARHFWMSAWVLAEHQCFAEKGSFATEEEAAFRLREAIRKRGYEDIDADNPYLIAFAMELRNAPNSLREYCLMPLPSDDQKMLWFSKYYRDVWGLGL